MTTTVENALDYLELTVPAFRSRIADRRVLDFGCGLGHQAVAMVKAGADSVHGLDIVPEHVTHTLALAARNGVDDQVSASITGSPRPTLDERFDVVVSCSSFEHFSDPEGILETMRQYLRPGGVALISFAEPWLSPRGSHMGFFTRVPWLNLLFPEETVMRVRASYRSDGATRYEEVEGGLNRMTLAKFERILEMSRWEVEWIRYYPTRGLPLVHRIPGVRELLTSAVSCELRRV